ncbi:hypothetical protein CROQUDRAFT_698651 [Cronartium quercuum f. sp. fusiforme G11]|uniref:cellulase n=1 Tax=Cronartium quercuum f. sp. fusiforme G11 TaxID=708437 RepID=A0A9P6NNP1_9BASI|nr:hypothetical protein CROQUDRAFT_698651 [Cronartium quercuum f. sp. fusiforme G11]
MLGTLRRIVLLTCFILSTSNCVYIKTGANQFSELHKRAGPNNQTTGQTQKFLPLMNGVNMPGMEFGIDNNGKKGPNPSYAPPKSQISHYLKKGKSVLNTIRIPIGWQYIQPTLKGDLDKTQLATLDSLIDEVLDNKGFAILDLHNFGRRDGKIVGESDLAVDALIDVWVKLAQHYKEKPRVVFGLMNEPHDQDSKKWIGVVDQLVQSIRNANATQNIITLPGNQWSHLKTFADDYNGGMSAIRNPNNTFDGLIFEIHQYFDNDGSGTSKECNKDLLDELSSVAALLKKDGRQALIGEMGGGNTKSCADIITKFSKAALAFYPSFAGLVSWAGGSFDAQYPLVNTVKKGDGWDDQMNLNAMKAAISEISKNTKPGNNSENKSRN